MNSIIKVISTQAGVQLKPATEKSIEMLRSFHVPENAITFYKQAEPSMCAEIDGVRLWPILDIAGENKDYVPGCFIKKHGYVVFATTLFGDAYCFDLNAAQTKLDAPIVLIAHDWNWDEITPERINILKKHIATNFESFLQSYVDEKLDIEPNY